MAQFYASIEGNRGPATRMGSKDSGIHGHLRGWSVGAKVNVWHDEKTGHDYVEVYATSGSNGHKGDKGDKLIARYSETEFDALQAITS